MSRIYEALRRAESERDSLKVATGQKLAPGTPSGELPGRELPGAEPSGPLEIHQPTAAGKPVLPSQTARGTAAAMLDGPPGEIYPPQVSPQVSPPISPRPPALDMQSIPFKPWNPSLDRLPALLERGRTVEQFRSLRSRMGEIRSAGPLKSILVSSGLPQEGKSFVAANLAISLARYKTSRVLLIDGDMRRCSLHTLLGCPNELPGLTEYLGGHATAEQIMQRRSPAGVPAGQDLPSLTFIAAGSASDKASDLSGNHRFQELMAAVSPSFDWIIVDSSPVNLVADGINLARACDGVLLVARGGVTKFAAAQRAVAAYKSIRILGFVLNAAADAAAVGEYYEYQGYSPSPLTQ